MASRLLAFGLPLADVKLREDAAVGFLLGSEEVIIEKSNGGNCWVHASEVREAAKHRQ